MVMVVAFRSVGYGARDEPRLLGFLGPLEFLAVKILNSNANAQQPKLFVGMILVLVFAKALALYGLVVGIILSSRAGQSRAD
ncbi:hypothetical protein RJ639_032278 [Escallonia herrerae]|uniref:V-ATPase proteolipid subunit C-like domain-containing protein n=1 Tax=Escallonia herrerae TaxID=1293975 RepID=A0AA88X2K5_9ASTE|nr:hypothetical protein RJ639_032278 [Escallonia herrerae]